MTYIPRHRASETASLAYTPEQRALARDMAADIVAAALALPTPEARAVTLAAAFHHEHPLIGYFVQANIITRLAEGRRG